MEHGSGDGRGAALQPTAYLSDRWMPFRWGRAPPIQAGEQPGMTKPANAPEAGKGEDDHTLGGYFAVHNRPPGFEAADGQPYTVSIETERTGDLRAPVAGYLVFPRWAATGPGNRGPCGDAGAVARGEPAGGGGGSGDPDPARGAAAAERGDCRERGGLVVVRRERRDGNGQRPAENGPARRNRR